MLLCWTLSEESCFLIFSFMSSGLCLYFFLIFKVFFFYMDHFLIWIWYNQFWIWICYKHCFCFTFLFFGHEASGNFSSPTRDWTSTPCIRRWSLNHWTTREVPFYFRSPFPTPLGASIDYFSVFYLNILKKVLQCCISFCHTTGPKSSCMVEQDWENI